VITNPTTTGDHMNIDPHAVQTWLSQPWVLTLGVLVIAGCLVLDFLGELCTAIAQTAQAVARAHRSWRRRTPRGFEWRKKLVDGQPRTLLVKTADDRDG
jgi:hypothetical protein